MGDLFVLPLNQPGAEAGELLAGLRWFAVFG